MPKSHPRRAPARRPTPYPDLNAVLAILLDKVRARLGDNFLGAYLQGSFAVGDADENSDCDFIVVTRRDIEDAEIPALDALHASIHDLPYEPWRHRLEGSYVPAAILRRWSATPRDPPGATPRPDDWGDPGTSGSPPRAYPFLYLDHGAKAVVRSEHDNTHVVRWSLREKGVTLAGPDPRSLVDPVSPADLRAEVRETMDRCVALDLQPIDLAVWQAFWVGLFCRMLHTLATGAVASKAAGAHWAAGALDPAWRGLIERAQALRHADLATKMAPADASEVAAARAFVRYAIDFADRGEKNRELIARILAERRQRPKGGQDGRPGGPGGPTAPRPGRFAPPPVRPGGRGRRG